VRLSHAIRLAQRDPAGRDRRNICHPTVLITQRTIMGSPTHYAGHHAGLGQPDSVSRIIALCRTACSVSGRRYPQCTAGTSSVRGDERVG
jgi:hypothetical protein